MIRSRSEKSVYKSSRPERARHSIRIRRKRVENVSLDPPIVIFLAQLDVRLRDVNDFHNVSFDPGAFRDVLDVFHDQLGDIIVFPEFYLPLESLPDAQGILRETCGPNKVYVVPISHFPISELTTLTETHDISVEGMPKGVSRQNAYVNLALVAVADCRRQLHMFAQIKTHPAELETKPHKPIYRARDLYIFCIGDVLSFSVPICFSLIGKDYSDSASLGALGPFLESGDVDCLFVPEFNPKPFHAAFIEAINHVCRVSRGNTSVVMVHVASGIGNSSIVDFLGKRLLTSEYDVRELENPNYRHLIFVSTSERLYRYEYVPRKAGPDRLTPEFVRAVPVDVFVFDEVWRPQHPQLVYDYRRGRRPIAFDREVAELRSRPYDVDYIAALSREQPYMENWDELLDHVRFVTQVAAEFDTREIISPNSLVWILRLVGEFHDLKGCAAGAYFFFDKMNLLASTLRDEGAVHVSGYLLMRTCSRMENIRMSSYALERARGFEKLATESPESLGAAGPFVPVILGESALLISHFSNTQGHMYAYGSYRAASLALEYNREEPDKEKLIRSLLIEGRKRIDKSRFEDTSRHHLHYLDICGLTSLLCGRPDEAAAMLDRIDKQEPDRLGYSGQYLATAHNRSLLLHLFGGRDEAEASYLKLLDEQRERQGSPSAITARNLSALLDDDELSTDLLRSVDYGKAPHVHTGRSREKAVRVYQLTGQALSHMR